MTTGACFDYNMYEAYEGSAEDIAPVGVPAKWDYETDVVILGAGGAGLCAAEAAMKNGAKVIVLEKQVKTGGHSQHGAIACTFNTKASKRKGLVTKRSNAFKFGFQIISNSTIDPKLLVAFIDRSHEPFDWAETQSWGNRWDALMLGQVPAQGVVRQKCKEVMQNAPFQHGKQMLGLMYPWMTWLAGDVREKGAQVMLGTKALALVKDGKNVVGVQAKDADGKTIYIKGNKAVILAGSGFSNNRAMIQKYCPDVYEKATGTFLPPSDTGEAMRMAVGAGADVAGRNSWVAFSGGIPFYDTTYTGKKEPGPWFQYLRQGWLQLSRGSGWLEINKAGEEFVPEMARADYEMHPRLIASQQDHRAYMIFDADYETNIWKTVPPPLMDDRPITTEDDKMPWNDKFAHMCETDWKESIRLAKEWGGIKSSDTIAGLAKELGLDPAKLENAVKKWNAKAAAGKQDEFGRNPANMIPIMKAPYYGIKTGAIIGGLFCGPRINYNMQVLDKNMDVIPGLYAAGSCAGGTNGENIFAATILSTMGLAYTTGWIAGDHATNPNPTYVPKEMIMESEIMSQRLLNTVTKYSAGLGDLAVKVGFFFGHMFEKKEKK
jgi:fumarate reductase flavoprotein subunit